VNDTLRVDNLGDEPLNWSAAADDSNVTLSPDNGIVNGGLHMSVNVSGTPSGSFNVNFTSDGGSPTITYTCTP
jgi:hypothetical protein